MSKKTITIKDKVFDKVGLTTSKLSYMLEKSFEDQQKLRNLASKITIIPEIVRVYSIPYIPKRERK